MRTEILIPRETCPIVPGEVTEELRYGSTDETRAISRFINAALDNMERYLGICLVETTFQTIYTGGPDHPWGYPIPYTPLISIESATFTNYLGEDISLTLREIGDYFSPERTYTISEYYNLEDGATKVIYKAGHLLPATSDGTIITREAHGYTDGQLVAITAAGLDKTNYEVANATADTFTLVGQTSLPNDLYIGVMNMALKHLVIQQASAYYNRGESPAGLTREIMRDAAKLRRSVLSI